MSRPKPLIVACLVALAAAFSACGQEIEVEEPADSSMQKGAELFAERCGGCHTLAAAGTQGSGKTGRTEDRTNGPNFNTRKESRDDVLFAIRNGGFSGAIMPANIVVGEEADQVAEFVAKYAGRGE